MSDNKIELLKLPETLCVSPVIIVNKIPDVVNKNTIVTDNISSTITDLLINKSCGV